jgi:hypothetical protein
LRGKREELSIHHHTRHHLDGKPFNSKKRFVYEYLIARSCNIAAVKKKKIIEMVERWMIIYRDNNNYVVATIVGKKKKNCLDFF